MHRKTTSRRENKRLDNKARRQAVAQAMRGDHLRLPKSGSYRFRQDLLPLDMDPRPSRRKREKKPIEYCPAREAEGKKRHYYVERTEERTYSIWWPEYHERPYTYRYKVCMYCGKKGRANRKGGKHYY